MQKRNVSSLSYVSKGEKVKNLKHTFCLEKKKGKTQEMTTKRKTKHNEKKNKIKTAKLFTTLLKVK